MICRLKPLGAFVLYRGRFLVYPRKRSVLAMCGALAVHFGRCR